MPIAAQAATTTTAESSYGFASVSTSSIPTTASKHLGSSADGSSHRDLRNPDQPPDMDVISGTGGDDENHDANIGNGGRSLSMSLGSAHLHPDYGVKVSSPRSEISRVRAFYEAFYPNKLKELPAALEQFAGKETEMKNKVIQKYLKDAQHFFTRGSSRGLRLCWLPLGSNLLIAPNCVPVYVTCS